MYNGIYDEERFAYEHGMLLQWLKVKQSGSGLADRLTDAGISSVAVYGIAGLGQEVRRELTGSHVHVSCLVDQRAGEYPAELDGIPVRSVAEFVRGYAGETVLVTPEYHFRSVFQALAAEKVPQNCIISLAMALT